MQSTEEEPRSPETIIHEAETAIWKDSEYFTAEDVFVLAKALAAERDRADRAEARLAQILEYADSTYTASTVARRIVQMGKATA